MKNDAQAENRRKFLWQLIAGGAALTALGAGYLWWENKKSNSQRAISGKILGASHETGHQLRNENPANPSKQITTTILIVGGGIAGLSAARWLSRNAISDFIVCELEAATGGNSHSGKNNISAYPWGAHYLPLPHGENKNLLEFLEECGSITGYESGLPVFNDTHLCFEPDERLFMHGQWQEGLVPAVGLSPDEKSQNDRFFSFIHSLKNKKGNDGKYLFSIPLDESSQDPEWTALDKITMLEWMNRQGYSSVPLQWYVNYCCRDDFGTPISQSSAWAGLHYFASRAGTGANAPEGSVLTWPEGNGFLAHGLKNQCKGKIQTSQICLSVENTADGIQAILLDTQTKEILSVRAQAAVLCTPQFIAQRIVKEKSFRSAVFTYSPWVIANISTEERPGGEGQPLSWDNVSYHSQSLGYIVADHQSLRGHATPQTVLTWYQPLDEQPSKQARTEALTKTWEHWRDLAVKDISRMHPGMENKISNIDVWIWGHAMIRPVPGFIWGEERKRAALADKNIHYAHSDLSGISIFEEAFHHGIRAAQEVLNQLNNHPAS